MSEMVKDLKAAVFPDREIKMMAVRDGVRNVRVIGTSNCIFASITLNHISRHCTVE